jgi:hypothetical protein
MERHAAVPGRWPPPAAVEIEGVPPSGPPPRVLVVRRLRLRHVRPCRRSWTSPGRSAGMSRRGSTLVLLPRPPASWTSSALETTLAPLCYQANSPRVPPSLVCGPQIALVLAGMQATLWPRPRVPPSYTAHSLLCVLTLYVCASFFFERCVLAPCVYG